MLERVQDRSLLHFLSPEGTTFLHGASKALAQWAIVDDYDHILDLSCGDGRLLNYLSKKYSLRACGIADNPDHARSLRGMMPDAEVFSARKEDIPWRSEAFNTVFYQMKNDDEDETGAFLNEVMRVLKPGGQVLIALHGLPGIVSSLASVMGVTDGAHVKHAKLMQWMEKAGLKDVSWRIAGPMTGIAMGWKNHETEAYAV